MNEDAHMTCPRCQDKGGVDMCCYAPYTTPEDMCDNCLEITSAPCPKCGRPLGWKEGEPYEKPKEAQ